MPWNRCGACGTQATRARQAAGSSAASGVPPTRIDPASGSTNRSSSRASVVLPAPVAPDDRDSRARPGCPATARRARPTAARVADADALEPDRRGPAGMGRGRASTARRRRTRVGVARRRLVEDREHLGRRRPARRSRRGSAPRAGAAAGRTPGVMNRTASARSNGIASAISRRPTSTATSAIATAPPQSSTRPVWNAVRSTSIVVSPQPVADLPQVARPARGSARTPGASAGRAAARRRTRSASAARRTGGR